MFRGSLLMRQAEGITMDISVSQPTITIVHDQLRARLHGWLLALALGASMSVAGVGIALPQPAIAHSTMITTHQIASETGGPGN
jgi:hypothetical protein